MAGNVDASIKGLWDKFVKATGRDEEDVKKLNEKDLDAEMNKRGFTGFDASDIRGYWKTLQGSYTAEPPHKRVRNLPPYGKILVRLGRALDQPTSNSDPIYAELSEKRIKCAKIIAALTQVQKEYTWQDDNLGLWALITETWDILAQSTDDVLCGFFPKPFFWCQSRKSLYQLVFWNIFNMEAARIRQDLGWSGYNTNRISKVVYGLKALGKTVLCGSLAAVCTTLFSGVIAGFCDYGTLDKWLPSELLEGIYEQRTGTHRSFDELLSLRDVTLVFISDEVQDVYILGGFNEVGIVSDLAQLSNTKKSISIATGSASAIPRMVFRSDDTSGEYKQFPDLNHTKHSKYLLLPIRTTEETKALYLLQHPEVSPDTIEEKAIHDIQWKHGGFVGSVLSQSAPSYNLPHFDSAQAHVLTELASAVINRDTVDPFHLPTISRQCLLGIMEQYGYEKPSAELDAWCDSGFLYEQESNVYTVVQPSLLVMVWDNPSGLTLEQLVALTPLSNQSLGHVSENMFLEDYSAQIGRIYKGRKLVDGRSAAKNAFQLTQFKQNLEESCTHIYQAGADKGSDGLVMSFSNGTVFAESILQIKFYIKTKRPDIGAIRAGLVREFLRFQDLFQNAGLSVDWSRMNFLVFHFGNVTTADVSELCAQLKGKRVIFHSAETMLRTMRPAAAHHINSRRHLYPFLHETDAPQAGSAQK